MQIGDATHRQSGNVADHDALGAGHGHRQGADGRGLIHDEQHGPFAGDGLDDRPELLLVLGKGPVEDLLAISVDGDRVVIAFADVNAYEDIDGIMVIDQRKPPRNSVL